jgi:hypothetical protein
VEKCTGCMAHSQSCLFMCLGPLGRASRAKRRSGVRLLFPVELRGFAS